MARLDELKAEYLQLSHAMQSGVATKMGQDALETTPKHLRVGVNSAMVETAALASLLIKKGVFTEEERLQAIVDSMRCEVEMYERELSEKLGTRVTLA